MAGEDGREPEARRWEGSGYLEEGQVEGSCSQEEAQGSAAWRIKHRDTSHTGENMPTMAVLMKGGERDTDRQRGEYRYPRYMI